MTNIFCLVSNFRYAVSRGLLLLCAMCVCSAVAAQTPAGQVMVATGSVKVIDAQGRERALEKGGELKTGDRIVTGEDGLAQVRMADGGYLSIRAGTEMKVDAFTYDEKNQQNSNFLVSLVKGGFRSITGLIGRTNPNAYKVVAGTATIGIRGTDHEPMVIPPGPPNIPVINAPGVYDKVNQGETFIQNERGILTLKPGQIGFAPIRPDLPPQVVLKVPDFYRENVKTDARDPKDTASRKDDDKANPTRPGGTALRPGFADRTPPADQPGTGEKRPGGGETAIRPASEPLAPRTALPPPPPPTTTYVSPSTDPLRTSTTILPPPTTTYVPPPTDPLRTTTTILPPTPTTTTTTTILPPPPPPPTTTTTTIIR